MSAKFIRGRPLVGLTLGTAALLAGASLTLAQQPTPTSNQAYGNATTVRREAGLGGEGYGGEETAEGGARGAGGADSAVS